MILDRAHAAALAGQMLFEEHMPGFTVAIRSGSASSVRAQGLLSILRNAFEDGAASTRAQGAIVRLNNHQCYPFFSEGRVVLALAPSRWGRSSFLFEGVRRHGRICERGRMLSSPDRYWWPEFREVVLPDAIAGFDYGLYAAPRETVTYRLRMHRPGGEGHDEVLYLGVGDVV